MGQSIVPSVCLRTGGDYADPYLMLDDKVFLAANPMSDRQMVIFQGPGAELPVSDVSQMSMFSQEEVHVRTGALPDSVLAWLVSGPDCSSTSYASLMSALPVGFCSRTSLAFCQPAPVRDASHHNRTQTTTPRPGSDPTTEDVTSLSSSESSVASPPTSPPTVGATGGSAAAPSAASPGVCWTLDISESPNGAVACSLSDVLQTGAVPQRFYLSAKAAQGILRRAEKRERVLPSALLLALRAVAAENPTTTGRRQGS